MLHSGDDSDKPGLLDKARGLFRGGETDQPGITDKVKATATKHFPKPAHKSMTDRVEESMTGTKESLSRPLNPESSSLPSFSSSTAPVNKPVSERVTESIVGVKEGTAHILGMAKSSMGLGGANQ